MSGELYGDHRRMRLARLPSGREPGTTNSDSVN